MSPMYLHYKGKKSTRSVKMDTVRTYMANLMQKVGDVMGDNFDIVES